MVDRVTITTGQTGPNAPGADASGTAMPTPPTPDNPSPPPSDKPSKPQWLPDKFWNADKGEANFEGLAKSYGELEKKQSTGKKADAPPADKSPAEGDATDVAKSAADAAGLNFESLQNKFYETGKLEDSDYEALQKAGIPKSMVDNYIAGIQLQVQQFATEMTGIVGGPENYAAMTSWAKDNLQPHEIDAYNAAVNSGDYNRAAQAVKALKLDFTAATGKEPKLMSGRSTTASSGDTYDNWKQVSADMNKPEYKRDPQFRRTVEERIKRSPNIR